MRTRTAVLAIAFVFQLWSLQATATGFTDRWKPAQTLDNIEDQALVDAYHQALEYLFPRIAIPFPDNPYTLVIRIRLNNQPERQLNIMAQQGEKDIDVEAWSLCAPYNFGERIDSSANARAVARSTKMMVRQVVITPRFKALFLRLLKTGIQVKPRGGLIIHGDLFDVWADWSTDHIEVHRTVPRGERDELTRWILALWDAAQPPSTAH